MKVPLGDQKSRRAPLCHVPLSLRKNAASQSTLGLVIESVSERGAETLHKATNRISLFAPPILQEVFSCYWRVFYQMVFFGGLFMEAEKNIFIEL